MDKIVYEAFISTRNDVRVAALRVAEVLYDIRNKNFVNENPGDVEVDDETNRIIVYYERQDGFAYGSITFPAEYLWTEGWESVERAAHAIPVVNFE